jgi:hypothetical protein
LCSLEASRRITAAARCTPSPLEETFAGGDRAESFHQARRVVLRLQAIAMDAPIVLDVVSDTYAIADKPWTPTGREFHAFQKSAG